MSPSRQQSSASARTSSHASGVIPGLEGLTTAAPVKAKRSRTPADLAAQYGEKVNAKALTRKSSKDDVRPRRARRTAADKARLQQVLRPDEDILTRLARVNTIGMSRKRVVIRRSKNWRARCGRCGTSTDLNVPAALCAKCGAILMRGEE